MSTMRTKAAVILLVAGHFLTSGCASLATGPLADNLAGAILNQDDPGTVEAGAPAYLLLIDGMLADEPEDRDLLLAGAELYGAYASVFVDEPERAKRLSAKANDFARRALCQSYPDVCTLERGDMSAYKQALEKVERDDVRMLYTYATTWAGRIQARPGDWEAIAELPRLELALERVIALQEDYEFGRAHVYLGVIRSQIPPSLGGKPEVGRAHFERAIRLSEGNDLIAKVEFARTYARLVFDQPLHDRLLNEVINANPYHHDLTLSNTLAQQQARDLLASGADYF